MKTMEMAMKKALAKQEADLKKLRLRVMEWEKPCIYDAKLVTVTVEEETVIFPELSVEVHGYLEIEGNGNDGIEQSNSEL